MLELELLTVTVHLYVLFCVSVKVIVQVPAFLAVILPDELTVAILVLLLFADFRVAPVNLSVVVSPTLRLVLVLLIVGFFTVTLHLKFLLFTLAVIVAVPEDFAETVPLDETVATFLLEVDQVTFLLVPLTFSVLVFPT